MMSGLSYSPLNASMNEICLLRVKKPEASSSASDILEYELVHVSLDNYTPQYTEFMELDRGKRSA